MPTSSIDSYLQDARNKFDAVRPAPICTDANQSMGQCRNVHVSTNCYYGYHDMKTHVNARAANDCEMMELEAAAVHDKTTSPAVSKKRSADEQDYPQSKRLRDDDSSMCSLVGTRSSPSHSASAFNANISTVYTLCVTFRLVFRIQVL